MFPVRAWSGVKGSRRPNLSLSADRRGRWLVFGILTLTIGAMVLAVDPRRFARSWSASTCV
jgi:hypothetical protein